MQCPAKIYMLLGPLSALVRLHTDCGTSPLAMMYGTDLKLLLA